MMYTYGYIIYLLIKFAHWRADVKESVLSVCMRVFNWLLC